jgi:hypothetical protein
MNPVELAFAIFFALVVFIIVGCMAASLGMSNPVLIGFFAGGIVCAICLLINRGKPMNIHDDDKDDWEGA